MCPVLSLSANDSSHSEKRAYLQRQFSFCRSHSWRVCSRIARDHIPERSIVQIVDMTYLTLLVRVHLRIRKYNDSQSACLQLK
jgi:hypothetical protein